ncbi:MAG: hypothetical protein M3Y40_05075 [Chloroflexota bacterium]|nr:hypothetical protein [Chloroflexota bacterium]
MTTQKLFKRRVRARMEKTGESYTTARQHLVARRVRRAEPPIDLSPALELASDEKMAAATGHGWEHWLSILDRWGARDRKHGEIATYLHEELGVPGWWTQAITNGYERTRGMRRKHQHADGYTIYASKTVGVPVDVLFQAFVDDDTRRQWLTDGTMSLRTSVAHKTARFDWGDGGTRILVTFDAKAPMKASAHVSHERLPDETVAEVAKAQWKKRVSSLQAFLEADR